MKGIRLIPAKQTVFSIILGAVAQMLLLFFVFLDFLHKILYDNTEYELLYRRENFGKEKRVW